MRHAARGGEREYAVTLFQYRCQCDEISRGNAMNDQRSVLRRVRTHVFQCQRLGLAFEVREKGNMASKVWNVFNRYAASTVHSGKVINALLTFVTNQRTDDVASSHHPLHFLVRAHKNLPTRITYDRIDRIPEAIGCQRSMALRGRFYCQIWIHAFLGKLTLSDNACVIGIKHLSIGASDRAALGF